MQELDKIIQRESTTFAQNLIEDIEVNSGISPTIKRALLKFPKTRDSKSNAQHKWA